jgi:uncharacterized membrane protein YphA (DoxX/SURF4 family)
MFGASIGDNKAMNIGWLLFRIHVGLSMAIHAGWPKLTNLGAPGWFNEQVAGLGFTFPSPAFWATISVWGEFAGGILIAIGLLTRFSAIQLAFQFFVIAFLWYDNPEPLTGMYFQHLLFWSFVLISFGGGGRYSLDRLLLNRSKIRSAAAKIAIASALLFVAVNTQAQSAVVNISDFKLLQGNWEGTLTYEDYSSHTSEKIKATGEIKIENENSFLLSIGYPDEPKMNSKNKYVIDKSGMTINDKKVIERTLQPGGLLRIVTEERGEDGNDHRPATFHQVWMISSKKFTLTKLVKFDTDKEFFQRNQYVFTR